MAAPAVKLTPGGQECLGIQALQFFGNNPQQGRADRNLLAQSPVASFLIRLENHRVFTDQHGKTVLITIALKTRFVFLLPVLKSDR